MIPRDLAEEASVAAASAGFVVADAGVGAGAGAGAGAGVGAGVGTDDVGSLSAFGVDGSTDAESWGDECPRA